MHNVNLGQSLFQDTFFVAQAQLTPFRQLRQIELELNSLNDSLKRAEFGRKRLELKIAGLDASDASQAIDIEEALWDMEQQQRMISDAESRRDNFVRLREELLLGVPAQYWEQGYEQAECDHWILYLTKELSISKMLGVPNRQAMEQLMLLPLEAQNQVLLGVNQQVQTFVLREKEVMQISVDAQVLPAPEPNKD